MKDTELEAGLKERETRFRSVFLNAADPMLVLDDDRRIVEANHAASALFGQSAEALVTRRLDELVVDGPATLPESWREFLALGEAKREHRVAALSPGDRGTRLVECTYRAAVLTGGHLVIARDITDRRQLEERLLQSEKVESVGRLAGGIAHDFNNLLTAILGYTELLSNNPSLDARGRSDLEEIQKAGQRAAGLTQQLLAYSRKQVLIPKEVDLNQAVLDLKGMLTRLIREDIVLTYALEETPAVIKIDPTQLEQVILNLVLNSRDALPGGGYIRLEVARVSLADVPMVADLNVQASEFVRLRVIDNGVGITPEVRAHLFEPFFTTKELGKGTGLGLASVYGIVRQSQGFISVESEPGCGATFTMHFPSVAARSPQTVQAGPIDAAPGRGTILLVEDEDAVRVVIGSLLRGHGYQVFEAASGRGACEIFDRHQDEIDLLLTDVVMPEMNGPALAQRLVAAKPGLRVLFISGYVNLSTPIAGGNPNIAMLTKPFDGWVLTAKVRELLSRNVTKTHG
jgi:two-component system, cell cycle sensor histidine kinase and response regulator CckA